MEKALRKALHNGKFGFVSPKRSRLMRAIKGRGNKNTELSFRMALIRKAIRGWEMHQNVSGTRPDFYFASLNLAVFIDGCFWHGCPHCGHIPKINRVFWETKIRINKERDLINNETLIRNRIKVVRFWEHDIVHNPDACVRVLFGDR